MNSTGSTRVRSPEEAAVDLYDECAGAMRLWYDYWMSREAMPMDLERDWTAIGMMVRQFAAVLGIETSPDSTGARE